jgi:hypothetical protein
MRLRNASISASNSAFAGNPTGPLAAQASVTTWSWGSIAIPADVSRACLDSFSIILPVGWNELLLAEILRHGANLVENRLGAECSTGFKIPHRRQKLNSNLTVDSFLQNTAENMAKINSSSFCVPWPSPHSLSSIDRDCS